MPNRIPTRKNPFSGAHVYERQADRQEDHRWYARKEWLQLRATVLAEQPLCEDCLRRGEVTAAKHVHHKIERKERPDLALERTNLESVCHSCHSKKHRHKGSNQ